MSARGAVRASRFANSLLSSFTLTCLSTEETDAQDVEIVPECVQCMPFSGSKLESFDLIVVGAGPSGSMAALTAQRKGVRTLLVEREEEVGSNVICGEGVGHSIFKDFFRLNPEWISSRVTGAVFRLQDWRAFRLNFPNAGLILNRRVFDRDLSEMARSSGVTILTGAVATDPVMEGTRVVGVRVGLGGRERHYFAPIVVGADGISSVVGRWVKLNTVLGVNEVISCAQWLVASQGIPENTVEFVIGREIAPGGYAWVFPKGPGTANVGVGISPALSEKRATDFLSDFVARRFRNAKVLERKPGGVSGVFKAEIAKENVLLCGDAARVSDPLSGAGIYNAVATGILAGEAVAERKSTGLASRYKKRVVRRLGRQLRLSEELRRIYLGLDEARLEEVWEFGRKRFSGETMGGVKLFRIISAFVCTHPGYMKYASRLIRASLQISNTT